jgi:hypothetical protein
MQSFPTEYKEKVKANAKNVPPATYTQCHKLVNHLNFEFEEYVQNFNWEDIPHNAQVESGINFYTNASFNEVINFDRDLYEDELSIKMHKYCTEELGLYVREMQMIKQPKNSLTGNHVDHHARIRRNNNLFDIMTEDVMFKYIKRYWVPLTDRAHGQYFELNGVQIENWKAGEVYRLWPAYPHCGANLGEDLRVFLIITGFDKPVEQIIEELS